MNFMVRILAFIVGIALFLFGIFASLGVIMEFLKREDEAEMFVGIVLLAFFGLAPIIGGFFLARWAIKVEKLKRSKYEEIENEVLKAAENRGGRITAVELAMDTTLTLEEAKELLEDWVTAGYVTIKISEGGALVYEFSGIPSEPEKRTAKGVSEH